MCLLIVLAGVYEECPLVMAANRDELLDRPASPMKVLRAADPRILGGRDEVAGGTWLAVNELGVVAGLTNRPATEGRDPAKLSRGELPIMIASHPTAPAAVDAVARSVRPSDYNPAWLVVGDRSSLFTVDMTGGSRPRVEPMPPGLHIVENRPPGTESPKVAHLRSLLDGIDNAGEDMTRRLQSVLGSHDSAHPANSACVHKEAFGTRWSGIVRVPSARDRQPEVLYSEGPACTATYHEATAMWNGGPGEQPG